MKEKILNFSVYDEHLQKYVQPSDKTKQQALCVLGCLDSFLINYHLSCSSDNEIVFEYRKINKDFILFSIREDIINCLYKIDGKRFFKKIKTLEDIKDIIKEYLE